MTYVEKTYKKNEKDLTGCMHYIEWILQIIFQYKVYSYSSHVQLSIFDMHWKDFTVHVQSEKCTYIQRSAIAGTSGWDVLGNK